MKNEHQTIQPEQNLEPEKSHNYFKVMLLFCLVMTVVVIGLYYLFTYLFN